MKISNDQQKRIGTALVIALVTTAAIWSVWRPTKTPAPQSPSAASVPITVYEAAVKKLSQQTNIAYTVSGVKETTVGQSTLTETFSQTIAYEDLNADSLCGYVKEELLIGTQKIESHEYFAGGTAYFTVQDGAFQTKMTSAEYQGRYIPAIPVDNTLYGTVSSTKITDTSTFTFTNPSAAEKWISADEVILKSATATATVDSRGNLAKSTYDITYIKNHVQYTLHVTVGVIYSNTPPIQLPDSSKYIVTDNIALPKTVEKACGYLTTLDSITSTYNDTIICEVFGDTHTSSVTITTGSKNNWSAKVDSVGSHIDTSKPGDTRITQTFEKYENGSYSYSSDGQNYIKDNSIDLNTMQEHCKGYLINSIILPEQIVTATVTETPETYQFDIRPNNDFASMLAENACYTLYKDATVLASQAQSHTTNDVSCYLHIDKETGFPVAYGFTYVGTYVLSDLPYTLSFEGNQTYSIPGLSANQ